MYFIIVSCAMTYILDSLQRDHQNIEQLLKVLEGELELFEKSERPDYEIIEEIVRYFQSYPELFHHPKEDLVFNKMKQVSPGAISQIGDLGADHILESQYLDRLSEVVKNILADVEVPREAFRKNAREFIDNERKHMRMEEEEFFPVALRELSASDWDELNTRMISSTDPLFDKSEKERFKKLYEYILRWESENKKGRSLESVL